MQKHVEIDEPEEDHEIEIGAQPRGRSISAPRSRSRATRSTSDEEAGGRRRAAGDMLLEDDDDGSPALPDDDVAPGLADEACRRPIPRATTRT